MNYSFLASFIALILIISISIKRQNKLFKAEEAAFWKKETQANSVRRKSLDNLPYIIIPFDSFPTELLAEDPQVQECIRIIRELSGQKIVNLTGYSNTDLKLEYGTANISDLSEFDQNYTTFVVTLQKWADVLWAADYKQEAASLMEFAVSTGTDISRSYSLLAEYWVSKGHADQVDTLLASAKKLRSFNRDKIISMLEERYPNVF